MLRRAAVLTAYLVALFVVYAWAVRALDPAGCVHAQNCTAGRRHLIDAVALVWLGLSTATILGAWRGLLPGARA